MANDRMRAMVKYQSESKRFQEKRQDREGKFIEMYGNDKKLVTLVHAIQDYQGMEDFYYGYFQALLDVEKGNI